MIHSENCKRVLHFNNCRSRLFNCLSYRNAQTVKHQMSSTKYNNNLLDINGLFIFAKWHYILLHSTKNINFNQTTHTRHGSPWDLGTDAEEIKWHTTYTIRWSQVYQQTGKKMWVTTCVIYIYQMLKSETGTTQR